MPRWNKIEDFPRWVQDAARAAIAAGTVVAHDKNGAPYRAYEFTERPYGVLRIDAMLVRRTSKDRGMSAESALASLFYLHDRSGYDDYSAQEEPRDG